MVQVSYHRKKFIGAVDVAQLVEPSHPTPEIHRLNPDIDKVVSTNLYNKKDENKEKEAGNDPSLKKSFSWIRFKLKSHQETIFKSSYPLK